MCLKEAQPQPEVAGEASDLLSQTHENEGFRFTFKGQRLHSSRVFWIERDFKSLSVSWYQVREHTFKIPQRIGAVLSRFIYVNTLI